MRIISAILALFLPPLGLFLWFGPAATAWVVSALWLTGMLVFWFLWAGPGLILCILASICACAAILFLQSSSSIQRAS